ncbi:hypothetical protein [Flammeovirga aprica]|uniref:Uncharacterized protein n=1 Tax=Flammeovirga aprica JL-4 TaxID=694437 RepID=A0A7X9RV98_9BACT|nr:hypothetical protein [Flammeovirga aprica]NME69360.1 hypothetical protein [Flammeovirga aprica JL-4]
MKNLIKLFAVIAVLSISSCNRSNEPGPIVNDRIDGEETPGNDKDPGSGDIDLEDGSEVIDRLPGAPEDGDEITKPEDQPIKPGQVRVTRDVISENSNTQQVCDVYEVSPEAQDLNQVIGQNEFVNIYTEGGRIDSIKVPSDWTLADLLKEEGVLVSELTNGVHWYKVDEQRKPIRTSIKVVKYTK